MIANVLAIAAALFAIGALIETHTWNLIVQDHARRLEALERGNKRDRADMVD